ncbi:MAG: hypothetical protein ACRDRI_02825 [Pseudonocardiaceae bacterium]
MVGAPLSAELLLSSNITEQQAQDVARAFSRFGVATRARRVLNHRGPADLEWLVLAALPLQAFLTGLGTEAVKDFYAALKSLVGHLPLPSRPVPNQVPLVLQDSRSGVRIVLEPDLPGQAYQQLLGLDLGRYRTGPLHYDRAAQRWRSELDEASSGYVRPHRDRGGPTGPETG